MENNKIQQIKDTIKWLKVRERDGGLYSIATGKAIANKRAELAQLFDEVEAQLAAYQNIEGQLNDKFPGLITKSAEELTFCFIQKETQSENINKVIVDFYNPSGLEHVDSGIVMSISVDRTKLIEDMRPILKNFIDNNFDKYFEVKRDVADDIKDTVERLKYLSTFFTTPNADDIKDIVSYDKESNLYVVKVDGKVINLCPNDLERLRK